jgi:hypothetical protein
MPLSRANSKNRSKVGNTLLARVRVPVGVWHGEQDLGVPAAHGRWLAGVIPGAGLHLLPDGHFSLIFGRESEVVGWLAEHRAGTADQRLVEDGVVCRHMGYQSPTSAEGGGRTSEDP